VLGAENGTLLLCLQAAGARPSPRTQRLQQRHLVHSDPAGVAQAVPAAYAVAPLRQPSSSSSSSSVTM
jgi:hypothetical protein